jgi:hypothetical protein
LKLINPCVRAGFDALVYDFNVDERRALEMIRHGPADYAAFYDGHAGSTLLRSWAPPAMPPESVPGCLLDLAERLDRQSPSSSAAASAVGHTARFTPGWS